jgi:hypothetical protein
MSAAPIAQPRRVMVEADRLEGFLGRLAERHGELSWSIDPTVVVVRAVDGTTAELRVPFPPLDGNPAAAYGGLLAHVLRIRTVGVVLVRRGGFGVGIVVGDSLTTSKVGSRHVQGRTAAGGWSQQRFARRREGQARVAFDAAADVVATVLLPAVGRLDAVVSGGDRSSCDRVLADPRLAPLRALLVADRLEVPEPRQRVLEAAARQVRAVRVIVTDPVGP